MKANFFGAERGDGLELTRAATRKSFSSALLGGGFGGGRIGGEGGGDCGGGEEGVGIDLMSIFWWRLAAEKGGGKMDSC